LSRRAAHTIHRFGHTLAQNAAQGDAQVRISPQKSIKVGFSQRPNVGLKQSVSGARLNAAGKQRGFAKKITLA
jgi:hypothetical protein